MRHIGTGDFKLTPKMQEYINDVLESNRLSYGQYSQRFEQEFAALHDCKYGVLSNSGTSSLLVALQTLKEVHDWQNGDEVIVPALTFVATVNVVLQCGLRPVLVDVESDYYGIAASKIQQAITDKTRCIIPVHTFGQPCNMFDLTGDERVKIIEDSCECVGVNHWNRPVGSMSDIACFSFYMAHHITCGIGGMAITNNPEYAKIMRSLVNHGMHYGDLSQDGTFNPWRTGRQFEFELVGYSFRVTELEAALGLAQLETLEKMLQKRMNNAAYLADGLIDLQVPVQLPIIRPNTEHSFMMYPLVCAEEDTRDKLTQHLNEKGIGTRRMLPLVNQPCYKGLWEPADYPVAQWIDRNGFYIGCHQHLTTEDLDYIIEMFKEFFR